MLLNLTLSAMDGVDVVVVILTMRLVVSMGISKAIQLVMSVKQSVYKNPCVFAPCVHAFSTEKHKYPNRCYIHGNISSSDIFSEWEYVKSKYFVPSTTSVETKEMNDGKNGNGNRHVGGDQKVKQLLTQLYVILIDNR